MDTLETIFNLQKDLADISTSTSTSARYPQTKERISGLATAIIHEAVKVQRLTNWKKPVKFDEVHAKE